MSKLLSVILLIYMVMSMAMAAERYPLSTPVQQQQFTRLTKQMRCLVCQNESLADSEAPLAQDLRRQIYQQVQKGQSDKAITHYMVARYGNFVLFKPPVLKSTWLLWFGPFIIMLIGFIIVARLIVKSKRNASSQGG